MSAGTEEILLPRTNVLEVKPWKRAFYPTRWQGKAAQKGFPKNWQKDKNIIKAMNALHLLQLTREEHLSRECLSVPIKFVYDSLPNMVKADVNIIKTGKSMFDVFTCDGEDFSSAINGKFLMDDANGGDVPYPPLYLDLRRKPYHFWVVDVGGGQLTRWQLVILHLGRNKAAFEGEDGQVEYDYADEEFGNIESIAVIDPEHGKAGELREAKTLDRFLQVLDALGFKPGPNFSRQKPWIPPCGKIDWSSGLRVFDIFRTSVNRITDSYCYDPRVHDGDNLWKPHSGWFNPDAVRSDMIGMAATMVNRGMHYMTRVAIEPIKSIKFRNGRTVKIQNMMPDRSQVYAFQPKKRKSGKPPVRYSDDVDAENGPGAAGIDHGYDSGTDSAVESDVDAYVDIPEPQAPESSNKTAKVPKAPKAPKASKVPKATKTPKAPSTPKAQKAPKTPKTPQAPKKAPGRKAAGKKAGTKKAVAKGKKKQEAEEDNAESDTDEGPTRHPLSVSDTSSPSFLDLLERYRSSYPDPVKSDHSSASEPEPEPEPESEPDNESDEDYQEKGAKKKGTKKGPKKGPKTPAKKPTKKAGKPAEETSRTRPLSDSEDEDDESEDLPEEAERKRRARILALSEEEMDTEEEAEEERWQRAMQAHLSPENYDTSDNEAGGEREQSATGAISRPPSPSPSSSSSSSSSSSRIPPPAAVSPSSSSSTSATSSSDDDNDGPSAKRRRIF
ncbi:hypothetical protein F4775DRAFT_589379 [Biscogniauxia sp. FL1348]|nr:hypothetical protein F4775DRAFT_589379 [Biscogniauxia sp. FL1348]